MKSIRTSLAIAAALTVGIAASASATSTRLIIKEANDANSAENPFIQPQDPALSGGGRDQSLKFGDFVNGTIRDDLLIGRLGVDVLKGRRGNDVIIGGTEHFNPENRDRAFGGGGKDVFLWAPGDGSDFFHGGRDVDAVVFGLMGEIEDGETVFRVSTDQQAGVIDIDRATNLPTVDVTNSPGFCEVIDRTAFEDEVALEELGIDHLVRFFIRGVAQSFADGTQTEDNGLRVTLHLQDVEVLVCTAEEGGAIELLDLTVNPPAPIGWSDLKPQLRKRLEAIVQ